MNKKKINIILMVCIAVVIVLSIGTYYYDEIPWGKEQDRPIELPVSNNYEISPPEIKNFEERLKNE